MNIPSQKPHPPNPNTLEKLLNSQYPHHFTSIQPKNSRLKASDIILLKINCIPLLLHQQYLQKEIIIIAKINKIPKNLIKNNHINIKKRLIELHRKKEFLIFPTLKNKNKNSNLIPNVLRIILPPQ